MGGYAAVLQSLSEQIGNLRNEVSEARKPQQTEEQTRNELARKFVV